VIRRSFLTRTIAALAAVTITPAQAKIKTADWNDRQLKWTQPSVGMQSLKRTGHGVMIVFANWCPVCHEYAKAFHHADVVAALQGVTLMRIDQDLGDKLLEKFSPDGKYVPRTFFLGPDGDPLTGLFDSDPEFKHFFLPNQPSDLAKLIRTMSSKSRAQ
jgi:thiol:disulfide interchange protein